ncbi:MAG: arginine--tRNA ligase [Candidatus Margulisbacteria bacterium]|nr:arginine--tRNA ligase [Candidatus Margulisiibacteriota bacterium]
MIKDTLKQKLASHLDHMECLPEKGFVLENPKNPLLGDYALTIAFDLAKQKRQNPLSIAKEIVLELSKRIPKEEMLFTDLNGYINIQFTDNEIWKMVSSNENRLDLFPKSSEKILIEFVSANPTGPLHIGHGRWAVLGDIMCRLKRAVGVTVSSEFYINDTGNQVKQFRNSVSAAKDKKPIPKEGYHGQYVLELAQESGDPVERMISQQKETLEKLNVTFDNWFSELSLHNGQVEAAISELKKEYTYEKEGALWFSSSQFGDDKDRVLIKATGDKTYFASDVAYHREKLSRGFTTLVNVFGADHHGYVARMKAATQAISKVEGILFNVETHFKIIIGQLVSLFREGKPIRMSKRTGEMITLREVIDEIGVDATRFFMVFKSADTHLDFDLEVAKKQSSDNPVYYIQYAHARICSVFRNLQVTPPFVHPENADLNSDERQMLLVALKLNDALYEAALHYQPHRFAAYTYQLAKQFHLFYQKCPIKSASEEDQKKRLFIVYFVQRCLKRSLDILGISAPEQM